MKKKKRAKTAKISKFEESVLKTIGLREAVATDMRPLFDHIIELARHSHKVGYAKRAGQELAKARRYAEVKWGGKL